MSNNKVPGRDELWRVIQGAHAINRHVDFFRWLQDEVSVFLPHDVLVAVWGDFATGRLHYDVASNIQEIHTQQVMSGCGVDPVMQELYRRWREGGETWYRLDQLDWAEGRPDAGNCLSALVRMRSALVHGIRDRRGKHDCLYVFLDKDILIDVEPATLQILLPLIDATLRRVECLAPAADANVDEISDREREIMNWVQYGKTNHEIGMILNISHNTVKNHLKRIFQKMDVCTRAQAVAKFKELRQAS